MIRIVPRYEDNKTYPILVKMSGGNYNIVEMLGSKTNAWNDEIERARCQICGHCKLK